MEDEMATEAECLLKQAIGESDVDTDFLSRKVTVTAMRSVERRVVAAAKAVSEGDPLLAVVAMRILAEAMKTLNETMMIASVILLAQTDFDPEDPAVEASMEKLIERFTDDMMAADRADIVSLEQAVGADGLTAGFDSWMDNNGKYT